MTKVVQRWAIFVYTAITRPRGLKVLSQSAKVLFRLLTLFSQPVKVYLNELRNLFHPEKDNFNR
ncbi:MAG: hypothetical protein Q4A00_01030 [Flavobacteriaceae bacterium]|nr:hypothetical protein [Flavobacteriaceae bacterium]